MISPERLDAMQQGWVRLVANFFVPPAEAYPVFDRLVQAYSEPQRHYHNLEHLAEMFRVLGRLPVQDFPAVALAVWFHDVIYDTRSKENEARSAAVATDWLGSLGVPAATTAKVEELVRATAHFSGEPPEDQDTRLLLDADLAILGAAEPRYDRYAADIRREYEWVPDAEYRHGRIAVLQNFLSRPRLYFSDRLNAEGDAPARGNLQREILTFRSARGVG